MTKSLILFVFGFMSVTQMQAIEDTTSLKTIKGITDKMLEFISFDKDEVKDWDEYRNLFLPSARKTSIRPDAPRLSSQVRSMNIEEFVRYAGPSYPAKGFEEYAIGLDVQEFNGIANVFQSFYCKTPDGSYEARGINSFQLVYLNDRWWIASTMYINCLLYTSPSPRDKRQSRMPSSA